MYSKLNRADGGVMRTHFVFFPRLTRPRDVVFVMSRGGWLRGEGAWDRAAVGARPGDDAEKA